MMLRDYHVDNHARNFLGLIMFFALKLSRKVKACSLAENRPADIFCFVGFVGFVGGFVYGFGWFWLIPCFSNYVM